MSRLYMCWRFMDYMSYQFKWVQSDTNNNWDKYKYVTEFYELIIYKYTRKKILIENCFVILFLIKHYFTSIIILIITYCHNNI